MIKDIVSYLSEGYSPNSLPSLGYWASQNMDKIYLKRKRKYPLVFNASINTGVVVVVFISSSNIDQLEERKKINNNKIFKIFKIKIKIIKEIFYI